MKPNITLKLIKEILAVSSKPIPKVRLAKMVYFAFKELVIDNYYNYQDLEFIRMPLGPVPADFSEVLQGDEDILVNITDVGLSYNRENYSLKTGVKIEKSNYYDLLREIVEKISSYPTSSLIEISHSDYSWINNNNGDKYFISPQDLIHFKGLSVTSGIENEMDDQLIQSKLVKGMKEEMVKDNSALEFPDYYSDK
ncbi:MAG: hypothetical protein UT63_C0051G0004 [Candidatus Gottesmanbacteria bacterium GW2011_GWC2_39_8]|uniref:Antitoxin SocA-like Panacea domain-containing protein n=1 Tax=Candidatus Gottesmanbacteria bacterium GW2011_GWC2_39_8 TaxID=1618450 RepID=A0A0G0T2V0_9BACT|nr:MAG: hypothetical protein UT63_C0051G0004 [Candidatus Gottesmanbacteria bacterium GW2011_GWC2_39_8]